jgi:hypothetical protein
MILLKQMLRYKLLIFFSLCCMAKPVFAVDDSNTYDIGIRQEENKSFLDSLWSFNSWPREKKALTINMAGAGAMLAIGTGTWGYGTSDFHFANEGWFDSDTYQGGADKLGHAYSGYILTEYYDSIYKQFGYSDKEAILWGALSGWSQMSFIEVCDGFSSEYGFSWEDEAMNTAGTALAYLRHCYPSLKDQFDYRMEWYPSPSVRHGDWSSPFTDYSGQKYLVALKPDGFLKTDNFLLNLVEFQFGYYCRGYDDNYYHKGRYTYYGIGLNITYLLEQLTGHRAGGIFDYVQLPFTYLSISTRMD